MPASSRRRGLAGSGRRGGWRLALLCVLLFAAGLWIGLEVAAPPPAPDFSTLGTADLPSSAGGDLRPGDEIRATSSAEPPVATPIAGGPIESEPRPESPPQVDSAVGDPAAAGSPASGSPAIGSPAVALVIDDLGRSVAQVDALETLGIDLTYSVLPFESRTAQVVAALHERGLEYLCHLPMEPRSAVDPGAGALRLSMSAETLSAATRRALDAVPGSRGVNNHMGSALAADEDAMRVVLAVLAERGLYFVDSRTTADTVGYRLARDLGVPATERQVFLDNDRDPEKIRRQFRELLARARRDGSALAIAHPYPETIATLRSEVARARSEGFVFVPASELVAR
ncbi:MAG: divergent polysaccharide deacetylase family protein [Acidobacteriota bacterium]